MPKRQVLLYVDDIYFACKNIDQYTKGYDPGKFRKDRKTVDAVIRNLEIIGEAAKNIPKEFRGKYPEIPWSKAAALRNKVSHEYFGVDESIIWKTIQEDIPRLEKEISKIKDALKEPHLF